MDLRDIVLIALLGAAVTVAAPTDSSRCAGECTQVYNPKFDYFPGKTYIYKYEASTALRLPGSENELRVSAVAEISVLTPCEFALKLSDVRLEGDPERAADFKKIVEEKPLLFSFTDGRINHVCPDAKEPTWSVNLKRGVLSTFQNTMDKDLESRVREVDVAGQCDTHYQVTATTGKGSTINKRKDLATCTRRVGRITSLQGNTYSSFSRIQSPPLTKSTQNCAHVIANNIIQSVECEEVHILRLFARGEHGATTVVKTKLTFVKQDKASVKNLPRKVGESSLLFDHSEEQPKVTNDVDETLAVVQDICQKSGDALKPEAANDFTRLTYLVRRLSADSIRSILQRLETGLCPTPKTKDIFLGAIKQAGTEGAVEVLVELINNNRIAGRRARIWLTSLAFIQRPTSGTIEAVIPLIDKPKPDRIALLSVSSLVYAFCRRNENCEKDKAVQKLIEKLGRHLSDKCKASSPEEEDTLIATLKSFGNIGRSEKFLPLIQGCVKDNSVPINIRLAAIQAFRRNSYDDSTRRILTQILEDHAQHTELRIASYLSLIRHPTSKTIQKIKWVLDHEIVNQVNTFIWTHLKNLQESKSPANYEVRKLVDDISLGKKFHIDGRKFSRSYEASFYSDKINAGVDLDTNVIFTPDSYVPRSVSLNLTFDLFGHSIDFLEVDVRAANFEYLLEKYYGPTGRITVNSREVLKSKLRDRWHKISEGIENEVTQHGTAGHRHRRDAPYETQKYKQLQSKVVIKRENKPEGSLSLKVFGNEIRWYDFHSLEDIYDHEDPYNLKDIFNKLAAHKEVDVARNIMFLDTTSTIPTASGFPLRYDLNGTASLGLKLKSHFDVRQFLLRPRSADIKSYVEPSASIEVAGSVIIDAGVTRLGWKLASTLYSSIAVDGTVLLKEGEELTVKLDLPKPTIDIINIKSNIYNVFRDTERIIEVPATTPRYELKGCSRRLGSLLGVELCTSISLPRPFINRDDARAPLRGPIAYGLSLRKVDPNLQGYHFTYLYKRETDPKSNLLNSKFKLSFNTPGSTTDREYTIDYELNRVNKNLRFNLKTPRTKIGLNGDVAISDTSREANLVLKVNDDDEYAFHGKASVERQGDKTILNPTWEITRPGSKKVVLTGRVIAQTNRIEIDIHDAPNSEKKPYLIKGHLSTKGDGSGDQRELTTDIEFVTPNIESKLSAALEVNDDDHGMKRAFQLSFQHGPPGGEKKSVSIKINRETKFEPNEYHIHRALEWKWSRYPEYNVRATVHIEKDDNEYENLVDVRWANDFEDDAKRFLFEHKNKIKRLSNGGLVGSGSLKIIYPRRNINWDVKSKVQYTSRRLLNYDLTLKYAEDKTVKVTVDYRNLSTRLLKYTLAVQADLPGREIRISDTTEETKPGEYEGKTILQWQRGESVTLTGFYKNQNRLGVVHHEGELVVQLENQPKPLRKYTGLLHVEKQKYKLFVQSVKPDKTYEVDIQLDRSNPDQATSKVSLKLPWIEGEATTKRSASGLDAQVDFKTDNRHVVGSANLNLNASPKTLVVDYKWDADRDESKRLSLKAVIERPRDRVADIKALLTAPNLNVKADVSYELPPVLFNGEHNVNFHVEYAPDKQVDFAATIFIDKNQANRRLSRGQVTIDSSTTNKIRINYTTELEVIQDERRLKAEFKIDRQAGSDLLVQINHVRGAKELHTKVDIQNDKGENFGIGLQADWDVGSGDGFVVGGGLAIKTPGRDFEVVIREGWKHNADGGHLVHENRLRVGPGREFGLAIELKFGSNSGLGAEVSGRLQVDTPFENFRTYKAQAGIFSQSGDPFIIKAHLDVVLGSGRSFKTEIRFDSANGGKKANVNLLVDSSRVPGAFEITLSFNSEVPRVVNLALTTRYGQDGLIKLEFLADVSRPDALLFNFIITTPIKDIPVIRTKLELQRKQNSAGVSVDVEWGPGKSISVVGELDKDVNGKLSISSEALNWSGVTASVTNVLVGARRTVTVKFELGPDNHIEWQAFVEKRSDEKQTAFGETKILVNGEEFLTLKFNEDKKPINHPVYKHSKAYELEIHNALVSIATRFVIISAKGLNPTFRICSLDGEKCISVETLINANSQDPRLGKISNEFYAKFIVQRAPGDSRTVGISYTSSQLRGIRERSARLLYNEEEKKFIGYDFKEELTGDANKPGYNRKYQVLLPSRTIEVRADKTGNDKGYIYNVHVLLDAVREPNRELTINVDVKRTVAGSSVTRISRIVIMHPELKNNVVITNELRLLQERIIFAQKTEIDVTGRKLTLDLELINVSNSPIGFNITYLIGIRQESAKNLDFKIRGHRGRTNEGRSFGFELYWLNKEGVPKTYTIFSEIDKVNHLINGMIRTPIRVFDWKGTYEKLEPSGIHGVRADIDFNYNNKLIRRAQIEYSSRPTVNLKYYANPADISRMFRLHGGLVDDRNFELSAVHTRDGQTIDDAAFRLNLNTSKLLFTSLRWRPGVLQDVRNGIDARSEDFSKGFEEAVQNFADLAKVEVADKTEDIRSVVNTIIVPVLSATRQRLATIRQELKRDLPPGNLDRLRDVLTSLFGDSLDIDAIMKSIEGSRNRIREAIAERLTRFGQILDGLGGSFDESLDKLADYIGSLPGRLREWRLRLRSRLPELVERVTGFIDSVQNAVSNILENQYVTKAVASIRQVWDKAVGWISNVTGGVIRPGSRDSLYERVKDLLYDYSRREGELPKIVKGILSAIRAVKKAIAEVIVNAQDAFYQYRDELLTSWSDIYSEFRNNPDFQALVEEIQAYRRELREKYLASDEEDSRGLTATLRENTDNVLARIRSRLEYLIGKDGVWDPKNGRIEYYIPLSRPIDSLRDLRHGLAWSSKERDERISFRQRLEHLRPHFKDASDFLPPFEAEAFLVGNQHYKTFDDRYFDFAGGCSYVLAEDFDDDNFTVIINYGGNSGDDVRKESLLVVADKHYIVIESNSKVSLDGQAVQLPVTIEGTQVTDVDNVIRVHNRKGVTVIYDFPNDFIAVNVSGFYFGKLGGLFGNYDNEPSNDFRNPDGQNLTRVDQFATSWEVAKNCPLQLNVASHDKAERGSDAYELCQNAFTSSWSPLEDCFYHVDPEPFLQMCLEETSPQLSRRDGESAKFCKVVRTYIHTCEHHNIRLDSPARCR